MTALACDGKGVDAVCADGGLVHIRTAAASDLAGLRALCASAAERPAELQVNLRQLTTAGNLERLLAPSDRDHHAVLACVRDRIVGVAAFERLGDPSPADSAELSLVADDGRDDCVATLLIEHLASVARHAGLRRFVADVPHPNDAMVTFVRDSGFETTTTFDDQVLRVVLDLKPGERMVAAIEERERAADAASLSPLLEPRSIAVVGASDRDGSVGHQVLCNILEGGFTGTVQAVNPHRDSVLGVPSVPSPADLPEAPDLAVIAVPASQVLDVVRACGERGTRSVLLLSSGFGEVGEAGKELQDDVLAVAREYGMRLVGPNCVGLVNTDPDVRLDATFAVLPMQPGELGLLSQSGAFGIAFLVAAARCGLGVSQFVSVGNKADVSGNDMLLCWEDDPRTQVIGMYLESIGDPRTFVRLARRVSRRKPILALKSGSSAAGHRAGRSHTAAAASSENAVDALFRAAGVLRMSTMQEMVDASRVLTEQPLPAGPRVAIIGNSGGPGMLAADAAVAAGLTVVELNQSTQRQLRLAVPTAPSVQNPVDLGAGVAADEVGAAVRALLAAAEVDALLTVFTEIAITDAHQVRRVLGHCAATSDKPIVATEVGAAACTVAIPKSKRSLPVFTFPEPAAAALGVAYRYAEIRAAHDTPELLCESADPTPARDVVEAAIASGAEWLGPRDIARLLEHYGIPTCPQRVVHSLDQAVLAAAELGYPVAVKLARGVLHKSDVGGARLGVSDELELRRVVAELAALKPGPDLEVLVQSMVGPGTEVIVGAVHDDQFGPLVMLGAGGVLADLMDDRAFRLGPLSAHDAAGMVDSLRLARLLDGFRGAPVVDRGAVQDVLIRVATLVDELPEVRELDLNPLICRSDGVFVVDARIRVAKTRPLRDPLARQLRGSHTAAGHSPAGTPFGVRPCCR
ncbi:MAG: GCN5-related N-acetyltransferase [Pseudonocardiales bacterium]|nr:GCN5-related N-acetyltransferase [Pseudonocardiales bacterium]